MTPLTESPDEIERKRANLARLTAPDAALAAKIARITTACKRDMPKPPTNTRRHADAFADDEVIG